MPAAEVSAQSGVLGLWTPEQPQMVSPHAASLQETVTYTRASCEIWGGRRGADEKARSRGSSALTTTPAALPQQLPPVPMLSQPVAITPALIHWFLERGVGAEGAGGARASYTLHSSASCILHPTSCILHHPASSCIPHPAYYIMHLKSHNPPSCILNNPASHILQHPAASCIPFLASSILHPTSCILHPISYILHP